MATWSIAIPVPIIKKEKINDKYPGIKIINAAPEDEIIKAESITILPPYLSKNIPAGTEKTP